MKELVWMVMKNCVSILQRRVTTALFSSLMSLILFCSGSAQAGSFAAGIRIVNIRPSAGIDNRLSNGGNEVDSDIKPELLLEYFPAKNLSLEYSWLYSQHSFIYGIPPEETGSTDLITQCFTIKWHPFTGTASSPYLGGGINKVITSKTFSTLPSFAIDNHTGWMAQTGIDLRLNENSWFNIDYRYLDVDTTARVGGVPYRFDISPHLFSFGWKYRM